MPLTWANWRDEMVLSDLPEPALLRCEGLADADCDWDWLAEYEMDCD